MKHLPMLFIAALWLTTACAFAGQDVTVVAASSEAAEGLDLHAVAELFKDADNLEVFERRLNDLDTGINNLDLNDDGEVDFIRVVETVENHAHLILLQVPLGDNEFQDVATIEVDRDGEDYHMVIRGNEIIYGPDYYYVPAYRHFYSWPIIVWVYRPTYRPYWSGFYWRHYPQWWHPYHPVVFHEYRTRTVKYTGRSTFILAKSPGVTAVRRVAYKPQNSTMVKKRTAVIYKNESGQKVRRSDGPDGTIDHRTSDGKRPDPPKTTTVKSSTVKKTGQRGEATVSKSKRTTTIEKSDGTSAKRTTQKTTVKKSNGKNGEVKATMRKSGKKRGNS